MSTFVIVMLAVVGWVAVGTLAALLLGAVVRRADRVEVLHAVDLQPAPASAEQLLPVAA